MDIIKNKMDEADVEMQDADCFEIYINNPEEHPEKKQIFDICIPVK